MKVFKCDRCGNTYDKQKKDALYLVGKYGCINKNNHLSGTYNYIDLCDSCLAELNDWMEGLDAKKGKCSDCKYDKKTQFEEPCKGCINAYTSKFKPKSEVQDK